MKSVLNLGMHQTVGNFPCLIQHKETGTVAIATGFNGSGFYTGTIVCARGRSKLGEHVNHMICTSWERTANSVTLSN